MNYTFNKKSKKLLKSSRALISLGIPTSIAVGPLGFRAELDIGPKGKRSRIYRDLGTDRPDFVTITDENDPRISQIVFFDKTSEDQGPPAAGPSTYGAMVNPAKHRDSPMSECFYF